MRSKLVKEAIMSRGLSVRQFAQSIGIPASTLQSAIEQDDGIEKMRFSNVVKICDALGLDLKTFEPIRKPFNVMMFSTEDLSGDEFNVLMMYREADGKIRDAVQAVLNSCAPIIENGRKESEKMVTEYERTHGPHESGSA
jgi:DNA-binding Xre family transcriptional regulator